MSFHNNCYSSRSNSFDERERDEIKSSKVEEGMRKRALLRVSKGMRNYDGKW
jgi:hypothetical protein